MRTPSTSPRARYAAPFVVAALAVGIGLGGGAVTNAGADPGLPARTAQELLVDLQQSDTQTISGTVKSTANLGLPEGLLSDSASSDLQSLVSGDHKLRVWADGETRQRLAVVGRGGESDVIRNGRDLWHWNSNDNSVMHSTLTSEPAAKPLQPNAAPQDLAKELLKSVDPTTKVSTSGTDKVAGRDVYELVLQPRTDGTLVSRVELGIDAKTHVPLRVQVYSVRAQEPAIEVGYTKVSFDKPAASVFAFSPPPGAKVKEQALPSKAPDKPNLKAGERPTVVGKGWNTVVVAKVGHLHARGHRGAPNAGSDPRSGNNPLAALPKVSGSWGSGRLLSGTLLSVVLTDDGRVAIGAVPAERLYSALTP